MGMFVYESLSVCVSLMHCVIYVCLSVREFQLMMVCVLYVGQNVCLLGVSFLKPKTPV